MTKPNARRAAASSAKPKSASSRAKQASVSPKPAPQQSSTKRSKAATPAPQRPVTLERPAVGRLIAVANQKGGVGKSTTAVSVSAALAELGQRVLVIDLDPQGNASTGLGIRHEAREVTVYDVLASEAPIEEAIVPTPIENLFAVPSTIDLAGAEIELVSQFSRELRLRKAIEPLTHGSFDYVFLDCPPSLGLLTINALAAAHELLVPIQCEYYALEGLGQLLRNVRLVQQNVNTGLRLTGIVMTMFDPRTKLSEQVVQEVRRYFGDRVYRTIIPRTVRLSEAPGFGLPITAYDPSSRGAESYRQLAVEVATRLPDETPLPSVEDVPSVSIQSTEPARAPRPLVRPEDVVPPDDEGSPEAPEPATVEVEQAETSSEQDVDVDVAETVDVSPPGDLVAGEPSITIDEGFTVEPSVNPVDDAQPNGSNPEAEAAAEPVSDQELEPTSGTTGGSEGGETRRRRGLFRRGGSR